MLHKTDFLLDFWKHGAQNMLSLPSSSFLRERKKCFCQNSKQSDRLCCQGVCRCVGCLFSDSPPWTWFTRVIMGALRHAPTSGFAHIIITYGLCRSPLADWALGQQRSEPRQQLDASRCTPPKKEASARRVVKIWGNGARICRQGLAHLCCLSCRAYVSSFVAAYRQQLSQLQRSLCTPHSTQPGVRRLGGWHFQRC